MERTSTYVILPQAQYDALIKRISDLEIQLEASEARVKETEAQLKESEAKVKILEVRIKTLESQIKKDSSNSHKPPSSDGYKKKIKNSREKSNRQSGGQLGHEGKTLEMVDRPDKVVRHKVSGYCKCGRNLEQIAVKEIQRRQVYNLPEKLYEVTEHQIEVKQCECGLIHRAECPVSGNTQYGEKMKALFTYMNQYQFLPYERLQEFSEDVIGLPLGGGTIEASNERCYEQLEKTEQQIIPKVIRFPKVINNGLLKTFFCCA